MPQNNDKSRFSADHAAVALSVLCTLHCLLLPVLLILVPTGSFFLFLSDESFHAWILVAVLPISLLAVISGYLHHKRVSTLALCLFGIAILVVSAAVGHDVFGHEGEIAVTIMGSVLIAAGHIKNIRLKRAACENNEAVNTN